MGHVRDLPSSGLGVDIEHDFKPAYKVLPRKKNVISDLKKTSQKSDRVYLATDPDREGEAIAWHLRELLVSGKKDAGRFHRVTFNEITRRAVRAAFDKPGAIDLKLVESQQTRRILDRLVGYEVSPLLWRRMRGARSAGRVQSVAVRLVVEREREIRAFNVQQYWTIEASLRRPAEPAAQGFRARLARIDGKKAVDIEAGEFLLADESAVRRAEAELRKASWTVRKVDVQTKRRNPAPPFMTSTLQRAGFARLRMSPQQTMQVAQELYEGVDLGKEGPVGLITYMRTDSLNVAREAQMETLQFVRDTMGAEYAPKKPNFFRSRETSQGAHEAIRPTSVSRTPDNVAKFLTPQQAALYELVWKRFVASQMTQAQVLTISVEVLARKWPSGAELAGRPESASASAKEPVDGCGQKPRDFLFRATSAEIAFPGFLRVYGIKEGDEDRFGSSPHPSGAAQPVDGTDRDKTGSSVGDQPEDDEPAAEGGMALGALKEGEELRLEELFSQRRETEPPPRYNEASLIKTLEDLGIGRPSTYAPTMMTIVKRKYVQKDRTALRPTDLGERTTDLLIKWLPHLMDVGFTSAMEEKLDEIESGKVKWVELVREFYGGLKPTLEAAMEVKFEETGMQCPACKEGRLRISEGRNGEFVSCSHYPKCRFSSDFRRLPGQTLIELVAPQPAGVNCPRCGAPMLVRSSRRMEFLACSAYPKCKTTLSFKRDPEGKIVPQVPQETGIACEKCGKPMVIRTGRSGEFLACAGYPDCRNTRSFTRDESGRVTIVDRAAASTPDAGSMRCETCGKPMVLRWKRRRRFYGCSGYPACKNVRPFTRMEPQRTGEKCEKCGRDMVVKVGQRGKFAACSGYPACRNAKPLK
jgi:DNA topoisomerase-1